MPKVAVLTAKAFLLYHPLIADLLGRYALCPGTRLGRCHGVDVLPSVLWVTLTGLPVARATIPLIVHPLMPIRRVCFVKSGRR